MIGDGAKYWAFISYSHRDTRVAAALQRALETYRIPRRLVGTRTAMGEVPAFLKPVFRDRDEMNAGTDLKASVREALLQSRWLLAVCSPDAARSPWVNREIVEFKKLHGEARVLAVIAAGEPFASRRPGREAEECFPEALRHALTPSGLPQGEELEPVAADLRLQGDGRRLAKLKLVAGMVGLGVDQLVRRDAQRRMRRLAAIATASMFGMAVMAVLTVMAVQSRNEAQVRRAQAEDLIEFMIGDLRNKLDPVGRLDVLDSLGEKALEYYARQDPDQLDAIALGHRSRAMHLIGEIRQTRGQLEAALIAFRSAADTTAQLLARAPDDGQRIFDHAQSVYWVGYIARRRGEAQAEEEAFLQYRELAQRLVRVDQGNLDWQLEAAYASQNLGVVRLERRRLPEALQMFSETRSVFLGQIDARPSLVFHLVNTHGWIAKTREGAGDYEAAVAAQQERLDALRAIPDSAKDRRLQQQIANANHELGRLQLSLGNLLAAEQYARNATEQAETLVVSDTANLSWQSESCVNRINLSEIEFGLGKRRLALGNLDRAMERISRLIARDASAVNWQINVKGRGLALNARLASAEARGFPAGALSEYLTKVRDFESQGKRLNAEQLGIVAAAELVLGDGLDRAGRGDAAREYWHSAVERLRPAAEDQDYPALTLLARLQLRLGKIAEARALAARVQASKYRHPVYAELTNELARATGTGTVQINDRER